MNISFLLHFSTIQPFRYRTEREPVQKLRDKPIGLSTTLSDGGHLCLFETTHPTQRHDRQGSVLSEFSGRMLKKAL